MFLPVTKKQHIHLPQSPAPACLLPQQHLPLLTACSLMSYRISASEGPCLTKGEMNKNTFFFSFTKHSHFTQWITTDRHMHVHADGAVREAHHVSVFDVNIPSMKASGGIHLTGSIAHPPFR